MLYTLTVRIAALNLYRCFGFVPLIRDRADVQAWDAASREMKTPITRADYLEA